MKTVTVEGRPVQFPDDASEEEISEALNRDFPKPLPETSALGAGVRGGLRNLLPSAATAFGAVKGAAIGEAVLPELTPFSGIGGAIIGGMGLGMGTSALQDAAVKKLAPGVSELEQADVQQHPIASAVGGLAAALPSFELNPGATLRGAAAIPRIVRGTQSAGDVRAAQALAANLALQGGVMPVGQAAMQGRLPTLPEVGESAAFGLLFGHPRAYLGGPGAVTTGVTDAISKRVAKKVPLEVPPGGRPKVGPRVPGPEEPANAQEEAALFSPQRKVHVAEAEDGGWVVTDGQTVFSPDAYPTAKEADKAMGSFYTQHLDEVPLAEVKWPKPSKTVRTGELPLEGEPEAPATEPEPEKPSLKEQTYQVHEAGAAKAAQNMGVEPVFEDTAPQDPDLPFHIQKGEAVAWYDPRDGKMHINRQEMRSWIDRMRARGLPESRISQVVTEAVASEEVIHSATDPNDAANYWRNLTKLEQYTVRRGYMGDPRDVPIDPKTGKPMVLSDELMGAEAIRRMVQRLHNITPAEIGEFSGREHWTQKTLDMLENVLFKIRRALGTKASQLQQDYIDRTLANLKEARKVIRPDLTELPAMISRKPSEEESKIARDKLEKMSGVMEIPRNSGEAREHIEQYEGYLAKLPRDGYPEESTARWMNHLIDLIKRAYPDWEEKDFPAVMSRKKRAERDRERIAAMRAAQQAQGERTGHLVNVPQQQLVDRHNALRAAGEFGPEFNAITDELVTRGQGARSEAFSGSQPGGLSRGPAPDLTTQTFAREATQGGIVGQEAAPGVSAAEAGALPKLTAVDIDRKIRSLLGGGQDLPPVGEGEGQVRPTVKFQGGVTRKIGADPFKELVRWGKANTDATEEQLRDMWRSYYVPVIEHATGEQLEGWRSDLNMEGVLGSRKIADEPGRTMTGDLPGLSLEIQPERETRLGRRTSPEQKAQEYRRAVQSALMRRLWDQSQPSPEMLARKEVALDDINWGNKATEQGAWREIHRDEAEDPSSLFDIFSDQARTSGDDVSATKRLAAMRDKKTGKIVLVSAYPHGRSGVMVYEPTGATGIAGKTHVDLSKLLNRWRPIASVLLKEPVKGFWKEFPDAEAWSKYLGKEGGTLGMQFQPGEFASRGRRARVSGGEPDAESAASIRDTYLANEGWEGVPEGIREQWEAEHVEGTPGIRGEGGGFTGEQADLGRATMGIGRGELESARGQPMTANEAMSVMHYVLDEAVGKFESPADMRRIMDRLVGLAENRKLKARDWSVISAIQKAAYHLKNTNPEAYPTLEGATDAALSKFYELIQNSEGQADYVHQALGQLSRPTGQGVEGRGPQFAQSVRPAGPGETGPVFQEPRTVEPGTLPPSGPAKSETERARESLQLTPLGEPFARFTNEEIHPTAEQRLLGQEPPTPATEKSTLQLKSEVQRQPGAPLTPEQQKALGEYVTPEEAYRRKVWEAAHATPGAFHEAPAAIVRGKSKANDEIDAVVSKLGTIVTRGEAKRDLARFRDAAQGAATQYSLQAANSIRVQSKDPQVMAAARAVIGAYVKEPNWLKNSKTGNWYRNKDAGQTHLDPAQFEKFIARAEVGEDKARQMMESNDFRDRRVGRAWLKAATQLREQAEFAREHHNDPDMEAVVESYKREMAEAVAFENKYGMNVTLKDNYVPGLYDPEFFDDQGVMFSSLSILGKNFRQRKRFNNVYDAISQGPYIPASHNVADLAQSRIYGGRATVNRRLFTMSTMGMTDPATGETIGAKPKSIITTDPETGENVTTGYSSPSPARTLVQTGLTTPPVAVLRGYERLMKNLLAESQVPDTVVGAAALRGASAFKHGALLMLDTFHGFRLGQYGVALGGRDWKTINAGYSGGWAALNFKLEDLPKAVEQGMVDKATADWATQEIPVRVGNKTENITRHQLVHHFIDGGLNATKIADAIYKDAVQSIPLIGEPLHKIISPFNRFIFDKLTPGMMAETAVRNFERLNAANPNIPLKTLVKDIVTDTNVFFGNMGRQGIFKNPTFRDMAQIALLAPSWLEGLVQKDVRFLGRLGLSGARLVGLNPPVRQGLPAMGTLGRGVGRGLLAYLIGTQIINLYTRGKPTWENEEKEHKFDAFIPTTAKGGGFWMSPMSVFSEIMHDIVRLGYSKPNVYEALRQIGENKLGPVGKMAHVLVTGKGPTGEKLTSTMGVAKEAAAQLAPIPITLSKPGQALLHAIAPGYVSPVKRGEMARQLMASGAGIKVEPARTVQQRVLTMAQDYVKKEGLRADPYDFEPTEEASYTKLRGAVRNEDEAGAASLLNQLRKTHSDSQIIKAMSLWARRPFTGSRKNEGQFLSSLSDKELQLYTDALMDKQNDLIAFEEFFMRHAQ